MTAPLPADRAFIDLASRYWHPVARSVDVDPGQVVAATLLDRDLVVWRTVDGTISVLDDLCSHRGTRLSGGAVTADGCLRCPYHAWSFADDGRCTSIPQLAADRSIPSQADVTGFRVSEHGGLIWTCLVDEASEARPRPTWDVVEDGEHWLHVGPVLTWETQAFRQIENFCDVAHFSILHADTFGNADALEVDPYRVDVSDDGHRLSFDYRYPSVDPTAEPGADGRRPIVGTDFAYRLELPLTVALGGASGPGTTMVVAGSPISATRTRIFWGCAFPLGTEVDPVAYDAVEHRIWSPDRAIVEGQRPERLPLDLVEELHLPFDRLAIAYRRALRDLGFVVPGGTAPVVDAPPN